MVKINIIEAKFKRDKGIYKNTKLWKELTEKEKYMFNKYDFSENEIAIICCIKPNYLLTNNRIISEKIDTHYTQLKGIKLSPLKNNKENIEAIELVKCDSKSLFLNIEIGTWPTIYNLLKLLINQAKQL